MVSTTQPSLVEEHFEPVIEHEGLDANDPDVSTVRQSSNDEHASGKRISGKNSRVPRYSFVLRIVLHLVVAWRTLRIFNSSVIVVPISLGRALFYVFPLWPIADGIKLVLKL